MPLVLYCMVIESPSTAVTVPSSSARIMSAASRAARPSTPVPMYGASARTSGTACFCMLAPMRARLASSCSRNGISDVAIETICFGETSIIWTSAGDTNEISVVAPKNTSRSSCSLSSPSVAACGERRTSTRSPLKLPSGCKRHVRLGDDVLLFLVGGEVHDLLGDLAVLDDAVRRLDEAELVDPGERGQGADQADVRAFRRLDRAHAAVVAEVDVADLEAGALTRQTTRTERREATPVGEARQRVHLVHELRQLAGAEELFDGGDDRPDVDQRLGRDGLDVLGRHALAHDALHAREADAHLVLDELAHRTDAAVGEVVLVVEAVARLLHHQVEHVGAGREDLGRREHGLVGLGPLDGDAEELLELVELGAELAVELVATDPREVVATGLEERVAEVGAGGLDRRRLARTGSLVDLEQRLVLGRRELLVLLPLTFEEVEVGHEPIEEAGVVLLVVAEGPEEREHRQATLAGDAAAGGDVLARLLLEVDLEPLAAVRVDGAGDELVLGQVTQTEALTWLEDDARRADELRHDDTLGAVDDEGALVGHHREVPHEDRLLLDLAGGGVHEAGAHEDRRGEGHVLLFALLDRELRRRAQIFVVRIELQLELERLGEVLDRD